jgi:tetratricopeptide (TPR) repeat protein/predicted Ser/Thr protein kinase
MLGQKISHYMILEKLGEGGMGVVYKAQDVQLQRPVALKFLPPHVVDHPAEKERFIHEAQAASALNHPNVTTIYEIGESPEGLFIAMEYVEGKTLKQIAEKEEPSLKRILDIAIQICEGLNAAHKKEIVHRDVKSDNIMITPEGQVKITDFGLAKLKGATKITDARSTLGTAAYMSPEQASGEEIDSRSDIFSFGVVLYELITGRLPFKGEHHAAIIYAILNETPEPLIRYRANVPEALQRIVEKALEKDKEERYQHIDDLLADLRKERKSLEYAKTTQVKPAAVVPRRKSKLLPILIPTSVVFVLVLVFLLLKPFNFEIVPEKKASAEENTLAIMYFENLVDREDKDRLGEIVTNLLITDLSESQYLNVVSSQRLYDILKLLGREGTKTIDKNVASEVATKAEAKWMLLGSILQVEPQIILTSQLVEVKTGNVLASQRIDGEPNEKIFSIVDRLTTELQKNLSLPVQEKPGKNRSVADVTTHSEEAYRYYLEGMDYFYKLYTEEAKRSFRKALELDSTFAMAYYWLADMSNGEEQMAFAAKAVQYSNKVSPKEKYYIECLEAGISGNREQEIKILKKIVEQYPDDKEGYFTLASIYQLQLMEFDSAAVYLNKAIAIDPLYKIAYNMLAYAYNELGDFEKSIWAINKYISLAPNEANPYDSRGDLYAYNGKLDQAIESYRKSLEMKPDFYASLMKLGCMYLYKEEYLRADSCFKVLSSCDNKETRSNGRVFLALIPLYQGKFTEALQVLDDGIAADRMEQVEGENNVNKHGLKALIYVERNQPDLALKEIETGRSIYKKIHPNDPVNMRDVYAIFLARDGKIKEAEEVLQSLKKDAEVNNKTGMDNYWRALGIVNLIKGDPDAAMTILIKGVKEAPLASFEARYFLAQAYLESGKIGEAVTELEKTIMRYDENRAVYAIWSVKAYYFLGSAYEKSGWNNKAIESYEKFLAIWKNADPGIPEVADAKEKVKRLRAAS